MAGKTGILFLILIFVNTRWLAIAALPPKETQKEVAIVEGYRSAKFGMTESEIYSAIEKDFDVNRRSVKKIENQFDKTTNLAVTVPKLLEEAGQARLFYILGYQNKKLIQINIIWGNPFDPNPNPQEILNAANVLRNYFLRKGFKQDDLLLNARLKDDSIVVFRGEDVQRRTVLLLLKTPSKSVEGEGGKNKELSLRLFYIENPNNPDIFKIKDGEF